MNWKACCLMAFASWMVGVTDSVIYVGMVFSFPYCGSLQVDHFFCEVPTLLRLSCADTSLFQDLIYACCVVMMLLPLGVVVASYARILMAVINMPSTEGKQKALTTCSSHLTVVGLYYGGGLFNYMQKASARTPAEDRAISTFYTIVAPMLNPLIYSLRNREAPSRERLENIQGHSSSDIHPAIMWFWNFVYKIFSKLFLGKKVMVLETGKKPERRLNSGKHIFYNSVNVKNIFTSEFWLSGTDKLRHLSV
ncbi:hypothetical protein M91_21354 [Bos mutus]|uniref:G-protein coupled receptors family 1 profile domain-containing protein n=1 Tax=Bos mutus TaxID=72004 RepID=L8HUM9_9CETA|nr:hypothetical protein M91_21354 [Bos mutus]